MIENIEQARKEFAGIFELICPGEKKIREYIDSNRKLVTLFEAKRHSHKYALQARLRIQAAEECLSKYF